MDKDSSSVPTVHLGLRGGDAQKGNVDSDKVALWVSPMPPQLSSDHMTNSKAQASDLEIKQRWSSLAEAQPCC